MLKNSHTFENKSKKLKSSVYITTFSTKTPIVNHVSKLVKSETINTFICSTTLNSFTKSLSDSNTFALKQSLNSYCPNIYFNNNDACNSLKHLYNDINKTQIKNNSSIIIVIPDNIFTSKTVKREIAFFEKLQALAIDKLLTINVLIYGRDIHLIKKMLSQHPNLCVGYSSLQSIDKKTFLYHVYYWGLNTGMRGESETYLTLNEDHSLTPQSKIGNDQTASPLNIDDESAIYISDTAIEKNQKTSDAMICSANNESLEKSLTILSRATIVLSCSTQNEVRLLGVSIYRLRKSFGQNIKIIVREMQPCLRYSDEMYLLQSGINLIIHFGTRFSSMLSSIEILRGQILTRPLPSSTEELLNFYSQSVKIKGYTTNERFVHYTSESLLHLDISQTEFALIKLELLPNIRPEAYFDMCNIQREGDVMTVCTSTIYLFLQGVRMTDLPVALHNIFTLPIRDIFASQTNFTTLGNVERELPNITQHAVIIENNSAQEEGRTHSAYDSSAPVILAKHKPLDF
ncbi:cellulose biosynthesis protein BcsE [Aliivibrio sp. S3MY1]|uniref:cellulose biosynthesis protein BcsE n=1 Tax=unclassified Aliivibrio TaxID=2645654 RepID=UPI002379432D|nr:MULTISPECIES: cellulose biosynthesis protein BcsE [unclassified Aliivibrio]MDD9195105.1 cellulose biosynthesis protein BcsE [Aliivibrio sp. S3MY1]MDD9198395.1 cellulose biosynthesis protein BcsE [Aliivibrio sp. S2MY1]